MKNKIKIELPTGEIIERIPRHKQSGNFCIIYITYQNKEYTVGDGDEYLRGNPDIFKLNYYVENDKIVYVKY